MMVPERFFFDKSQLERSITSFMFNNSLLVYFQKMLPSSKKLEKYGMGEPPTHQESLLLSHAREVHHAHSHIRGHLAGGAHALHIFGPGVTALAHAAKESFLRIHCAVHVHAAVLKSIAVMTPTHAHHFIHFLHLVCVHHFIPPKFPSHSKHLMTGI